ncbi:IS110 family transposase (plasmid) [Kovacikia minuta CCNUW1]|uniref:IS110 family transposase n=1 Tax=Kovacikia minuta TaxID=2931930 RepID=UPI001CCF5DDE|nr:IS110 family transposase [Kovacikia minuta]UBF24224.1 IS110 family transposase [Kovacikia minuta CCNUW1]UBF24626.1 IS110 family transposase [Kovacikia minuta CCNUW1]UBF25088.1 IS110 family transposase [Kovacikia minuta CCNUW1]UBF25404.1 IS110 family transposase [Kovacikia minuta CCNUW1]UBF25638.1 IS110 family transposase [Kovacikia minuta CCNUW1]
MSSSSPVVDAVLGLDIGKTRIHGVLLCGTQALRRKAVANTVAGHQELLAWLSQQRFTQLHACLEATSTYGHAIAKQLHHAGYGVTIANPQAVHAYAQSRLSRTKTDAADARLIAEYCRDLKPELWQPPAPEVEVLQNLMRRVQALEQMIGQETNRLETAPPELVSEINTHITFMEDQLKALRDKIRTHIDQFPGLKRQHELLDSIPGIGPHTAALILAEIGSWQHFASARQLAAYAGLTPQEKTSGTSIHGKPRLCKLGNARLRKALFLPALCLLRWSKPIQAWRAQLLQRHKTKRQVVGAVMHKLIRWIYGVLHANKPFDAQVCFPTSST